MSNKNKPPKDQDPVKVDASRDASTLTSAEVDPADWVRGLVGGGNQTLAVDAEEPHPDKVTAGEAERDPEGEIVANQASDSDGSPSDRDATGPGKIGSSPAASATEITALKERLAEFERRLAGLTATEDGPPERPSIRKPVSGGGEPKPGWVQWEGSLPKDPLAPRVRFWAPKNAAEARERYFEVAGIIRSDHAPRVTRI